MPQHPRYEVRVSIKSEILDDRFQDKINEQARELSRQAAAYVKVSMEGQLLARLTKGMSAQHAQFAVSVFVDELSHIYAQIGQVNYQLLEAPPEFQLPPPPLQLAPPTPPQLSLEDIEEGLVVDGPQDP